MGMHMNEPLYQVGELVFRSLDIDCYENPNRDIKNPVSYSIIKIIGECVDNNYWLYIYHTRTEKDFEIVTFNESELRSRKDAELTFKMVEQKALYTAQEKENVITNTRLEMQKIVATTVANKFDRSMLDQLMAATVTIPPIISRADEKVAFSIDVKTDEEAKLLSSITNVETKS